MASSYYTTKQLASLGIPRKVLALWLHVGRLQERRITDDMPAQFGITHESVVQCLSESAGFGDVVERLGSLRQPAG